MYGHRNTPFKFLVRGENYVSASVDEMLIGAPVAPQHVKSPECHARYLLCPQTLTPPNTHKIPLISSL